MRWLMKFWKNKIFSITSNHRNSQLLTNLSAQHVINLIMHWNNGRFHRFGISELSMAAFLSSSGVTLMFVKVSDKFGFFHAGIVNFRWNTFRFRYCSRNSSSRHSMASSIASFMFAISSSRVFPWLNASGSCLHCPQYHPVSGFFSMIILYSINNFLFCKNNEKIFSRSPFENFLK